MANDLIAKSLWAWPLPISLRNCETFLFARFRSEQFHVLCLDFSNILALTALVNIASVAESAFYVKLVAFMYILFRYLRKILVQQNGVPIGMFRHLRSVLKGVSTLCCGKGYTGNCLVMVEVTHFRITTDIAY